MREETHEALRRLFEQALDLPPDERVACLDRECPPSLRPRLEAMLAAAECDDTFLADPPTGAAPTIDAPVSPVSAVPGARIGPYRLLQQIGEGGFGVVFLAEQREPVQRRVALKVIKVGMDTKAVIARFEAERQALALMDHPNIARVLEAGATETGRPYFVMELVKGEPVTRYCDALALGIPERLALFMQVCHAVQHAHAKGVIHRDLKPSNILVSTQDGRPLSKVIDFGIAKATDHRLTERTLFTEHRALIGTPEYMSPEQAEGSLDIDTRSDVYALGVLLYELLTGARPFDGRQLRGLPYGEIQRILREEEPQKPSTRVSTLATLEQVALQRRAEPRKLGTLLRGDLDWIVMRCLEKERSRRYDTAVALAEDVRRHLASEPVLAGPPGAAYRLRKFVGRHKVGVAAGSLVAAALVLGLAGTSAGMAWALREQERAVRRQAEAEAAQGREREQRELAEKRQKETQQVTDFQVAMLNGIDVEAMGHGIKVRIREQVRSALERQYVGEFPDRRKRTPEEIEAELSAFDHHANVVHAVDVARGVMDEFVLARAAKALEEQFVDQPLVRAELHAAIGQTYRRLGLYDAAEQHLRKALDIREQEPDAGPELVAKSLFQLAQLLDYKYDFAATEPLARKALELSREAFGDRSPPVADCLGLLATCLDKKNDDVEAEELFRAALAMRSELFGATHPAVVIDKNGLAMFLTDRGDYSRAEALLTDALAIARGAHDRYAEAAVLLNLGNSLALRGDRASAEPHFRKALEIRRDLLGDENPHVACVLLYLGRTCDLKGDLGLAEDLYAEALGILRTHTPHGHVDMAVLLESYATILYKRRRYSAAEPLYGEALSMLRDRAESQSVRLGSILHHLADCLRRAGNPELAMPLAHEAVDLYRQRPARQGPVYELNDEDAHALEVLAEIHGALGQHGERVAFLREAGTLRGQAGPNFSLANNWIRVSTSLRAMGELEKAEEAVRQAVAIHRAIADPSPEQREAHRRAVDSLLQLLIESGKPSDAIGAQQEFVDDCRPLMSAEDARLAVALARLGRLLVENGQGAEAEPVLRECVAIREVALEPGSPDYWLLANARSMLGGALVGQAMALVESNSSAAIPKLTQAEPLLVESAEWSKENADLIPQGVRTERLRQSLDRVLRLYECWDTVAPGTGKADRAAEWRARLSEASEPPPGKEE